MLIILRTATFALAMCSISAVAEEVPTTRTPGELINILLFLTCTHNFPLADVERATTLFFEAARS